MDTTKKSSFVLIAESEEIRGLWIEAFVNIFRSDTTAPKLGAGDDLTKELQSLAEMPLSADKLLDPPSKKSKIMLQLKEDQNDEAYYGCRDKVIISPP